MSWYTAAVMLLIAFTVLTGWTATCWPRPLRDGGTAVAASSAVGLWMVLNAGPAGPTAADLAALPVLMLASLLMGRTVVLARAAAFTALPEAGSLPRGQDGGSGEEAQGTE